MVHLIGLKPRVQNVKLVKTIYLPHCFPPVTYSEGIVRKFSNVVSGICISVPLFFSITTKVIAGGVFREEVICPVSPSKWPTEP